VTGERIRLFVALELPEEVRSALERWRAEALRGIEPVRPIPARYMHVTLCFLGSCPVGAVDAIAAACGVVEGRAVGGLRLEHAIWLPRRRPRVLAVVVADPLAALAAAQAALAAALAEGGWYEPEQRPFLAHASVARLGHGARIPREPPLSPPALPVTPQRITLYRSRLRRDGARYEALAAVALASDPDELAASRSHPSTLAQSRGNGGASSGPRVADGR
jgi:RNA 2',3'-cyclic 3'-phosphodiesterase